jgi:hypothetical protein
LSWKRCFEWAKSTQSSEAGVREMLDCVTHDGLGSVPFVLNSTRGHETMNRHRGRSLPGRAAADSGSRDVVGRSRVDGRARRSSSSTCWSPPTRTTTCSCGSYPSHPSHSGSQPIRRKPQNCAAFELSGRCVATHQACAASHPAAYEPGSCASGSRASTDRPPSTGSVTPLMKLASSESR